MFGYVLKTTLLFAVIGLLYSLVSIWFANHVLIPIFNMFTPPMHRRCKKLLVRASLIMTAEYVLCFSLTGVAVGFLLYGGTAACWQVVHRFQSVASITIVGTISGGLLGFGLGMLMDRAAVRACAVMICGQKWSSSVGELRLPYSWTEIIQYAGYGLALGNIAGLAIGISLGWPIK